MALSNSEREEMRGYLQELEATYDKTKVTVSKLLSNMAELEKEWERVTDLLLEEKKVSDEKTD